MYNLPSPEPMSMYTVRMKAEALFWDYVKEVGEDYILKNGLNFDDAYDSVIYPRYEIAMDRNIDLGVDDDGIEIFGQFLPHHNVALISRNLIVRNDPRLLFTTIHEVVGHGILHGNYLRKTGKDYPHLYSTRESIFMENAFEHQANTMAINFVAPEGFVLALYWKVFGTRRNINYTGPGRYSLCFNNKNWSVWANSPYHLAWLIAKKLKHYFWGLSTESLMYRVLKAVINCNGYNNRNFSSSRKIDSIGDLL